MPSRAPQPGSAAFQSFIEGLDRHIRQRTRDDFFGVNRTTVPSFSSWAERANTLTTNWFTASLPNMRWNDEPPWSRERHFSVDNLIRNFIAVAKCHEDKVFCRPTTYAVS